jgi:hypothetical protein
MHTTRCYAILRLYFQSHCIQSCKTGPYSIVEIQVGANQLHNQRGIVWSPICISILCLLAAPNNRTKSRLNFWCTVLQNTVRLISMHPSVQCVTELATSNKKRLIDYLFYWWGVSYVNVELRPLMSPLSTPHVTDE